MSFRGSSYFMLLPMSVARLLRWLDQYYSLIDTGHCDSCGREAAQLEVLIESLNVYLEICSTVDLSTENHYHVHLEVPSNVEP